MKMFGKIELNEELREKNWNLSNLSSIGNFQKIV
jgi:hypothetical protein